jgi:hypothetical protein
MDVPKAKVKLTFSVRCCLNSTSTVGYFYLTKNILLQCFDLVDKDWLSKSDPIVILQEKKKPQDPWTFIGRTEMLKDNTSPAFQDKITLVGVFSNSVCSSLKWIGDAVQFVYWLWLRIASF